MSLLTASERSFLEAVSRVGCCNPFLPELLEFEREALGDEFIEDDAVWSLAVADPDLMRINTSRILRRLQALVDLLRERLKQDPTGTRQ
jgi:hypothetical protein